MEGAKEGGKMKGRRARGIEQDSEKAQAGGGKREKEIKSCCGTGGGRKERKGERMNKSERRKGE